MSSCSTVAIAQQILGISTILSRGSMVMGVFTDRFNNLIYDTIAVYDDRIQIKKRAAKAVELYTIGT